MGEPTLCMRSEIPPSTTNLTNNASSNINTNTNSTNNSTVDVSSKILLKTRILLRQVYNRQGDNIITWCEPFYPSENEEVDADTLANGGVDLALSFQDNAGCLDIWRQITEVQSRAAELIRERTTAATTSLSNSTLLNPFSNSSNLSSSGNNNNTTNALSSTNSTSSNYSLSSQNSSISCNTPLHSNLSSTQNNSYAQDDDSDSSTNSNNNTSNTSIQLTAEAMEAARHAQLHHHHHHHHQQQNQSHSAQNQHNMFVSSQSFSEDEDSFPESDAESAAVSIAAVAAAAFGSHNSSLLQQQNSFDVSSLSRQLPIPTLSNLEEISDIFAASQIQQREALSAFLSNNDCAYVKSLLALFPSAEEKDDFGVLATLAASIKSILLLNDPTIVELIVMEEEVFENVCCALEYDPDLRVKANHRWFIRERVKFKTVVRMEDEELMSAIHRSFRVNYLRDTLLRPTMDESSLSTLASLLQFTQAEVVRGVTFCPPLSTEDTLSKLNMGGLGRQKQDSYLMKVLRMLGREIRALREIETGMILGVSSSSASNNAEDEVGNNKQQSSQSSIDSNSMEMETTPTTTNTTTIIPMHSSNSNRSSDSFSSSTLWKQHLVPQDSSLSSRKIRRQGCLSFLRELFNMVRGSLQQSAKDDFYAMIVFMDIDLNERANGSKDSNTSTTHNHNPTSINDLNKMETSSTSSPSPLPASISPMKGGGGFLQDQVNLLSLMSATISDPHSEVSDRSAALEILSSIVMHDPSLVRRHCLDEFATNTSHLQSEEHYPGRPEPDEHKQVLFHCGPNDLLLSLLYLMAIETDAGLLLQTSEILRIILDTEMMEQGPLVGCVEDETSAITGLGNSEQNKFLALFYEHYVQWLVAPFQYTILVSRLSICGLSTTPISSSTAVGTKPVSSDEKELYLQHSYTCPKCAIRSSFSVELLCFCVKAHFYRMKIFVLKNRVLASVLKLMNESSSEQAHSSRMEGGGDRCLKLACLRYVCVL